MSLHVNRESNETCEKCNKICNAVHFQQNFDNWTSGDSYIDKLIQDTQLLAHNYVSKALEWIPYNRLVNIEYIVEGFLNVYRADWIDGNIIEWDNNSQNWKRHNQNMFVALKGFNDSEKTLNFINEVI